MEAKVDIRRLQMLNDRIAQTLDALNQVRLSVHAVGQTSPTPGIGFPGVGLNHTTAMQGYGQIAGVGQVPFGQVPFQATFGQVPFGQPTFGQVPFGQLSPWFGNSIFPQQTFPNLFGQQAWNGLSHTTPEQLYGVTNTGIGYGNNNNVYGVDPYLQNRVNPMFPLAQWPVTPFV